MPRLAIQKAVPCTAAEYRRHDGTDGLGRECLFPDVPWNRDNFFRNKRSDNGRRTESPGRVVITYPVLE